MFQLGYSLSSEEHRPNDLVRHAQRAENAGFTFALISDHFHPWIDKQGESPFVWNVIGGIATTTKKIRLGTGVTCPTMRIHPAIIAQAAATAASMLDGRFFLGVGTGENLNEHVLGRKWPPAAVRLEMLQEAIEVMRLLWKGGVRNHRGRYYTVENARLYTLPKEPPSIFVAAGGERSAELAAQVGDGLIGVGAAKKVVESFEAKGGSRKPKYAQLNVCWAPTEQEARRTAFEWWPISAFASPLLSELPLPSQFRQAAEMISEDDVAKQVICGPDPEAHIEAIRECADAGFDYAYIHQVGKDQEGFFRFYEKEILPEFDHAPGPRTTFIPRGESLKIRDIMTPDVEVVPPELSVKDVAKRMQILDIGFIPVCENDRLIGTVTDRDIAISAVAQDLDLNRTRVSDIMTSEVFFCYEDQELSAASQLMQDAQVRRLVVLSRKQRLVGVLSLGDVSLAEGQESLAGDTLRETSDPAA